MSTLVDDKDYKNLIKINWYFHKKPKDVCGYAVSRTGFKLHRWLLNAKHGQLVDHINGNSLDNRRKNLRFVTPYQSAWNIKYNKLKKSKGCKGVSRVRNKRGISKYWIARITVCGNRLYLGTFKNHISASRAYIKASKKIHGVYSPWSR